MKTALTTLLGTVAALLAAHIVVAAWLPSIIVERYPGPIARLYAGKSSVAPREQVAKLEPVEGRPGVSRVVLIPAAVERIGITTERIVERPVERARRIGAHLVAASALPPAIATRLAAGALAAAVPLSGAADAVLPEAPADIVPMTAMPNGPTAQRSAAAATTARHAVKARALGVDAGEGIRGGSRTAYFEVPPGHAYEPGDFVLAKVRLVRDGAPAKVISADAVLIEPNGRSWVYVRTGPNVFVREPVDIERGDEATAVLKLGPPVGTEVVTAGTFELYGAESAIGLERVGH